MARWLIALVFGFVLIGSLVSAAAEDIATSRRPALRETGLVMMLLGTLLLIGVGFYFYIGRTRTRQRALMELLALTPSQFELAIANVLRDLGYREVTHVGRSNDLGADLKAWSPKGEYVVVQCKRLAPGSKVSSPDFQTFIGMTLVHHRAHRGIFITTAEFTQPAADLARQHPITLWDGRVLATTLARIHGSQTRTAA